MFYHISYYFCSIFSINSVFHCQIPLTSTHSLANATQIYILNTGYFISYCCIVCCDILSALLCGFCLERLPD